MKHWLDHPKPAEPEMDGRLLHATFTLRHNETLIRIISARPMNRKERVTYERANEDNSNVSK